jgi:insulysin
MRVVNLSSENSYLARFRDQNPQNNNSAICNLFQVGHYKPALSSRLALLAHVINEPCFNELRTNEQLGYLVFSGVSEHAGVVFLRFIIQSSTYPADYLDSRTEAFLFDYRNKLVAMNAETFQVAT